MIPCCLEAGGTACDCNSLTCRKAEAAERYDIGVNGFEKMGYYGTVCVTNDPHDAMHCEHRHTTYLDALRCAEALRDKRYAEHVERLARLAAMPKPQRWIRVDGEIGEDLDGYAPSTTRIHRDTDRDYDWLRENEG